MQQYSLSHNKFIEVGKKGIFNSKKNEKLLNAIIENQQMFIVIWTLDGKVVWFNSNARSIAGFTEKDLKIMITIESFIPKMIVNQIKENLKNMGNTKALYQAKECPLTFRDGSKIFVDWHNYLLFGKEKYIISIGINVTDYLNIIEQLKIANRNLAAKYEQLIEQPEKQSAADKDPLAQENKIKIGLTEIIKHQGLLKKSEERYGLVVEGASDALWDWDIVIDSAYISWWKNILGFEQQEIKDYYINWISRIHPGDFSRVIKRLEDHLKGTEPFFSCEYRIKLKNGKYIWILSKGKAIWNNYGQAVRMVGSHTEITQFKKAEAKLKRMAYHDQLTGLLLRKVFVEKIKAAIKNAQKSGGKLAVLFLDLDNFKTINDTYGHHIGDRYLKIVTLKLKSCLRKTDILCRMGGDEFALLMPKIFNQKDVEDCSQRIICLFNDPLKICGHNIHITISIGAAIFPFHGKNAINLLDNADIAMYESKKTGKNKLTLFNSQIYRKEHFRREIKRDLRSAIENQQFYLCYQPIIEVATGKIVSLEALLRWKNPRKGIISPEIFVPVAEETGLIIQLGEWVLEKACRQLKEWHEMGYSEYCISVNISAIQLQQPEFADKIMNILAKNKLSPHYLVLEITETAFMDFTDIVKNNLKSLGEKGVKISIDDFGIGYNSLKILQKSVVDSLKIDKTFTISIDANRLFINTIISLGHQINAAIVAEGVETEKQYEYLKEKGCDMVQGYYFSKPLLPGEVLEFIKNCSQKFFYY